MKVNLEKRSEVMERSIRLGHCICDPRRPCPCPVFRDQDLCPCAGERPDPIDISEVKLTRLVRNAGCASKIAPADLESVLSHLPQVRDPAVISGLAAADDAAIYRISEELCLVQTVDVFTPCVDDPHLFGRICAANCLSDIYAMGGDPKTALSILAFPAEHLPADIMHRMLTGAMETLAEAGVALIGGHSIKDDEIKLGFAVTGVIQPTVAEKLDRPADGDILVLTKPLGTGVLAFASQVGRAPRAGEEAAANSMCRLNRGAANAMRNTGASGCTDITGFGLFGHLLRMVRAKGLSAELNAGSLPSFPGVMQLLGEGIISGGIERNREFLGNSLGLAPGVDPAFVYLGCDPQTSGGLLISVAPERLSLLQERLEHNGCDAFVIGTLSNSSAGHIRLNPHSANATTETTATAPRHLEPNPPMPDEQHPTPPPHGTDCCAEIFSPHASTEPDAQRAYAAYMRAVTGNGALSEKTKELILFSLVVMSRCAPCFSTHWKKARDMGFTERELDEAAWCATAMGGGPVRAFYQEALASVGGKT